MDSLALPANPGERAGAWVLLERLKASQRGQKIALIRADEGFAGADWEAQVQTHLNWPVEIIRKPKAQVGFAVLPRRWVIEQTFGCWGRYRRLSKDYEQNPSFSRAMLLLTAIRRAVHYRNPAPSHDPPSKTRQPVRQALIVSRCLFNPARDVKALILRQRGAAPRLSLILI